MKLDEASSPAKMAALADRARGLVRELGCRLRDLAEAQKPLPIDPKVMRGATDKIMADVTSLLGQLRGEDPPERPYHPAVERRKVRAEIRKLADAGGSGGSSPRADSANAEAGANGSAKN